MRPIDDLTKKRPLARPIAAIGALASQHEVRQLVPPAVGISAVVEWARLHTPEQLVIPLRTGLPSWLGHQGINRGWHVHVIAARDTLTRCGDDVMPVLMELWLHATEQTVVDTPVDRDTAVKAAVPILGMAEILGHRLPNLGMVPSTVMEVAQ